MDYGFSILLEEIFCVVEHKERLVSRGGVMGDKLWLTEWILKLTGLF